MEVSVDSIWASPSTLHMRVLVWVGREKHMKKFYAAVPLDDIEEQALARLTQRVVSEPSSTVEAAQDPLW